VRNDWLSESPSFCLTGELVECELPEAMQHIAFMCFGDVLRELIIGELKVLRYDQVGAASDPASQAALTLATFLPPLLSIANEATYTIHRRFFLLICRCPRAMLSAPIIGAEDRVLVMIVDLCKLSPAILPWAASFTLPAGHVLL